MAYTVYLGLMLYTKQVGPWWKIDLMILLLKKVRFLSYMIWDWIPIAIENCNMTTNR